MKKIVALTLAWALLSWGCTIADEDRCPSGYEYRVDDKVCYLIVFPFRRFSPECPRER